MPKPVSPAVSDERLLVVGDSLSAEYGLARGQGWVALMTETLHRAAPRAQVTNASISGETTAGGAQRLPALLAAHHPTLVIIELGANDALRGLALTQTRQHLEDMMRACELASARVVLVGMRAPPNYGSRFTQEFAALFESMAHAHHAALVPFLLAGIADDADAQRWFQPDGLHPVAAAQPTLMRNVWRVVAPMLRPPVRP